MITKGHSNLIFSFNIDFAVTGMEASVGMSISSSGPRDLYHLMILLMNIQTAMQMLTRLVY